MSKRHPRTGQTDRNAAEHASFDPVCELAGYERARRHYLETAGGLDRIAYDLCQDPESHRDAAKLYAKTALIARGYKTGIEAMIVAAPDGHGGMDRLVETLLRNAEAIEEGVESICAEGRQLTRSTINRLLPVHGRLTALLANVTARPGARPGAGLPRSFVSKYLHCHAPAVPLYDAWVDRPARRLVGRVPIAEQIVSGAPIDGVYRAFVLRFWRLYDSLRRSDPTAPLAVRIFDYYLVTRSRYRPRRRSREAIGRSRGRK